MHLVGGLVDDAQAVLDARPILGAARASDNLEIDPDRGEGLADLVVKFPRR